MILIEHASFDDATIWEQVVTAHMSDMLMWLKSSAAAERRTA